MRDDSLSAPNMHTSQLGRRGMTPGTQSLARGAAASKIGCSFSAMAMLPPIFSLRIRKACRAMTCISGPAWSSLKRQPPPPPPLRELRPCYSAWEVRMR